VWRHAVKVIRLFGISMLTLIMGTPVWRRQGFGYPFGVKMLAPIFTRTDSAAMTRKRLMQRPQKITLRWAFAAPWSIAATTTAAIRSRSARTAGPIMSACPISKRSSFVRRVGSRVPISGGLQLGQEAAARKSPVLSGGIGRGFSRGAPKNIGAPENYLCWHWQVCSVSDLPSRCRPMSASSHHALIRVL
jgi:hypothetical protein